MSNTAITSIDTNNFDAMAKAMGVANETESKKSSTLPRLRISHQGIFGEQSLDGGRKVKAEIIPAGTFKLEHPDGEIFYAPEITIRPYLQRFMYKRFVKGTEREPNRFVKTVMGENINKDLKDNDGGFNCGKPSGWIKDFKSLPTTTQDLIRQIKRTRVLFGTVDLLDVVDVNGDAAEVNNQPFIWEIDNRTAYKTLGDVFNQFNKKRRLPLQHNITLETKAVALPNGNEYYVPTTDVDMDDTLTIDTKDQELFTMFLDWVESYNTYILTSWNEKNDDGMTDADKALAEDMGNVFEQEEVPF